MNIINNFDSLASSKEREVALHIAEAAYAAIDTKKAVNKGISLDGNILTINGSPYDLSEYKKIKVLGFGKASCVAAAALEEILEEHIDEGVVVSNNLESCKVIKTELGTHPTPTTGNVEASEKIVRMADEASEEDLVIVIISGGGSSLLCWPESERVQGERLYNDFLKTGGTIDELNTIRKHISKLKGGGLAKILYPATVVGLIFSDVPGDDCSIIASGPLCPSKANKKDAEAIIEKYDLGEFDLEETPQDKKYFEKVRNFFLVNNEIALMAMEAKAKKLGFETIIASSSLYQFPEDVVDLFKEHSKPGHVILAGGETKIVIKTKGGKGGRNELLSLVAAKELKPGQVFISLASDGLDNGDAAGAVADETTIQRGKDIGLDENKLLEAMDAYTYFEKLDDLIYTGPTRENVSDLIILVTK